MDPVQDLFDKAFTAHKAGRLDEAARGYHAILNRNPYDPMLLYLLGNTHLQKRENGAAIAFFEAAVRQQEDLGGAWNDLGCALKAEHFDDAAATAWQRAIEIEGETVGTVNNLATLYADSGYPEKAMPWIDKAMQLDASNPHVHWNRALALLSMGQWADGWQEHEWRKRIPNGSIASRTYGPEWQGESEGTLVVHGEQGLGDEIMFSTCVSDLIREFPKLKLVFEVEKRLVPLFSRAFDSPAFANEKQVKEAGIVADFQVGLGSLPARYRRRDEDFPAKTSLYADADLIAEAKALLAPFPRPWIGYSWMGGTKITRVQHRSLSAAALMGLHPCGTAISLQYGDLTDVEADAAGMLRFGDWTDGTNLDKLAAFIFALDDVVSVCTTLIHLTGALSLPAKVLTPLRSSWRYGLRSGFGAMVWYPQHVLYRQDTEGDWTNVLADVKRDLEEQWLPR